MSMDDRGIARARQVLGGLELLRGVDGGNLAVTRLGGLTNLVFRVDHGSEHYVLRVPGKGTAGPTSTRAASRAAWAS